jgi:uncharacterized damage-inducible protein DinB
MLLLSSHRPLRRSLLLICAFATPAFAQSNPAGSAPRTGTAYAQRLWDEVSKYLMKAANDAPEAMYAYKPVSEVRSFGEMLDHVAASQNGYCREAMGEKAVGGGARTGAKTRAEVIEALRQSNELCARAYGQTEEATSLPAYDGDKRSRLYVLLENAMHDNEHYGNIVTYLRLNHMVPPSSQVSAGTR